MSSPQATRSQGKYGSKYHLSSYRRTAAAVLDEAIVHALDLKPPKAPLEWIYPLQNETRAEPTGAEFLGLNLEQREVWAKFWPKSGTPQTWDGIARFQCPQGSTWILIEAKTNHPEFCSPPCGAKSTASLSMIKHSLSETKAALGVHRFFPWYGTYYQYANRLAFLHFLRKINVSAHLVFLYFYGDSFPDGTPCPDSPDRWRELIRACHLTLGLSDGHTFRTWVHNVFLQVPAPG